MPRRLRRVAAGACLLAGLAGCGGDGDTSTNDAGRAAPPAALNPLITQAGGVAETLEVDGERAIVVAPRGKAFPKRVVLYVHGASQNAEAITKPGGVGRGVVPALVKAGYAVAASDARGNNWGSTRSLRDHRALRAELRRRGARQVFVLAASMGGLDGLRLTDGAEAFAGIFPVCDLSSMARGPLRASIAKVWGGAVPARLSPVRVVRGRRLPMLFWASPGDTLVPKRPNTDRCAADARAAGARVEVIETVGDHGDASNFDPERLVRFFDEAGLDNIGK